MSGSDLERLHDARAFSVHARDDAGGARGGPLTGATSQRATLYDLAIIGETLHRVSAEVKSSAPEIEWREFAELRNFVVHAYWQVDFDIIADVVRNRLDPLIEALNRLIAFVERAER